ncbi:hypothetical protein SMD22_06420 [Brevibacillus halotolerans]|nr:hypothetical protein SMD22_06420 [Brevibacillus halotolerans]
MEKYRKKPVVIEAIRFSGGIEGLTKELCDFLRWSESDTHYELLVEGENKGGIVIRTLEGDMVASPGDYIIKGVNGEFYPCKPDIFKKTYQLVENREANMTEQQIIETLATEVMGWRWIYHVELDSWGWHSPDEFRRAWNPLRNIADAWQLVDKIGPFQYWKSPVPNGNYQHFAKFFYHGHWYSENGATTQDAICRTALKAYGIDLTLR